MSREQAVSVLQSRGFDARLNGRGIFVNVNAGVRGAPLHALADAGLRVQDLEVLAANDVNRYTTTGEL